MNYFYKVEINSTNDIILYEKIYIKDISMVANYTIEHIKFFGYYCLKYTDPIRILYIDLNSNNIDKRHFEYHKITRILKSLIRNDKINSIIL